MPVDVSAVAVLTRLHVQPWFAQKEDGRVCDLEEMTYGETFIRMINLMYVKHEKRWIDRTQRDLVGDWVRRIEER